MGNGQEKNRNKWTGLNHGSSVQPPQKQTYTSEGYPQGYASAEGYTSEESQDDYSEYSVSTRNSDDNSQKSDFIDNEDVSEQEVQELVSSRRQRREFKSATKPEKQQPKSKRAQLRERIAKDNDGEVSSGTDAPKGLVEWHDGVFKWWDAEEKRWAKAAYHDQYRQQFIEEDAAEGTYDVAPECGKGALDITTFCGAYNQGEWRIADRESWKNIVDCEGTYPRIPLPTRPL